MLLHVFFWILGYAVAAWIIVFLLGRFTNVFRGAHPAILLWAPILPFAYLAIYYEDFKYEFRMKKFKKISRWIVKELRREGILVREEFGIATIPTRGDSTEFPASGYCSYRDSAEVWADVPEGKEHAYRLVYTRAIKKFSSLTQSQICSGSQPMELLDRNWALENGFREYFAKEYYAPCVDCKEVRPWGVLCWGDEDVHKKQRGADQITTFYFKDKPKRTVRGYVCRDCMHKIRYTSAESGFQQTAS